MTDDLRDRLIEAASHAICADNCDPAWDQPHCDWEQVWSDAKVAVDAILPLVQARDEYPDRL